MTTTAPEALSSQQVVDRLGITYRQLDALARDVFGMSQGSGSRRHWDPEVVRCLDVAVALTAAVPQWPEGHCSALPRFARDVLDGPTPAERGWALWVRGTVVYPTTPRQLADMFRQLADMLRGCDAIVARIPEALS